MQINSPIYPQFNPPGGLEDLDTQQKKGWHEKINQMFNKSQEDEEGIREQFFNPSITEKPSSLAEKKISWIGYPKLLDNIAKPEAWKVADEHRAEDNPYDNLPKQRKAGVQDEYCEWWVERNENNKITRVTFTCEGPEYWEFLAKKSPEKLVTLYQQYISPEVKKEDLFDEKGQYLSGSNGKYNKWNCSKGPAMHLIQMNNTLAAEVELAAGATVVRKIEGEILTDPQRLIKCGKYGNPGRNSDPHIGSEVNTLARDGLNISLKDPVGLYFDFEGFSTDGWETPEEDTSPMDFWKITRGTKETPLRVVYEVPQDKNYVVGDITINGAPINYGAQIAEYVRIKLTGIGYGKVEVQPKLKCRGSVTTTDVVTETALAMPSTTLESTAKKKVTRSD